MQNLHIRRFYYYLYNRIWFIRILDDFIKVVLKRNLGLTSKQKFLGQVVISIIFTLLQRQFEFSTEVTIPGIKGQSI